eukprot:CAMPEP_0197520426 /NCGR_PEP_ID=MMETSP1318-20131121/5773_1 /TAXON_ID=552666 /ORGANISM="Partenskyella glossopodia, Strain RCC365" /LENGTH=431 /DNA_ID=CAMNT_0043071987 /DNA_START=395 /DNA_END=1690 /DNA_ORIENTATION=-
MNQRSNQRSYPHLRLPTATTPARSLSLASVRSHNYGSTINQNPPISQQQQQRQQQVVGKPTRFRHRLTKPLMAARKLVMGRATSSGSETSSKSGKFSLFKAYEKTMSVATQMFPLWTLLSAVLAIKNPASFAWFDTKWFTAGLGVLMLSMGITLSPADFAKVLSKPLPVAVGFVSCYGLMPLIALGLAKAFALPKALTAGLVLCGSINGGQASNLCAYIAKGNVALSVMMTLSTTVGAIVMTPLLSKFLLGTNVPVDAQGIAISTMQVVLLPLVLGMGMKQLVPRFVEAMTPLTPVVGVISTCLLVGSAVAQVAPDIVSAGLTLQLAAMLLHLIGGLAGYWAMRALKQDEITSRTSGIETSMKSSAFGFLLAKLHFGDYAARVPPAVSVVWMALIGATMAVVWRRMPINEQPAAGDTTTGALAENPIPETA